MRKKCCNHYQKPNYQENCSLGFGEFRNDNEDVTYINCSDEVDLLQKFMEFWTRRYPDVITGWNTEFFDIPYLINRVTKILGEDKN